jgi:V/A-type H+-transporting ATPase subunit E
MQSHLDLMRWNLVRDVEQRLEARMRDFMQDEAAYSGWLQSLIIGAAAQIERDAMVVSANGRDHQRLFARWDAIVDQFPRGRTATLSESPIETLGGVLVTSADGCIRVDNTFEGRLDRLRPLIQQVILERLLPSGFDTGNLFTG